MKKKLFSISAALVCFRNAAKGRVTTANELIKAFSEVATALGGRVTVSEGNTAIIVEISEWDTAKRIHNLAAEYDPCAILETGK
jgi:hypothetical protein